ncbi:MAG TPA: GNAT family N-acetyltransferase, partial [Arcobacter sp.]|nr:GNAT family N-acetyltransferase [Arcobacter sp.]
MQIKICDSIAEIAKDDWNGLVVDNNPFLKHEFLYALEKHNCVGER